MASMKADPTAYTRASSVAVLGLVIQATVGLAFLLYAVFGRDNASLYAFFAGALGLPVWLGLALVFHQSKLERQEAIEAETLSRGTAAQASVFQGSGADDDLRVAAKRLAWMHKFLLPAITLLVAGGLIGVGLWKFREGQAQLNPVGFRKPELTGWAVALGIGIAVLGFIFARFVAGMAKQRAWSQLRAGASYLVGTALLGLALAVAHGVAFAGNDVVLRYLHVAIPVFMIALGGEMLLNFVLNIYRPRKAGEAPRPAFDSRVLGFLAAPDRFVDSLSGAINYQFGFEVSSTWFYQLLSRSLVSLLALAILVIWMLSSLAVVRPNERGLLLQFGRLVREVDSGLHIKAPWPFQTLETHPALAARTVNVGTQSPQLDGPVLWTKPHVSGEKEILLVVQPSRPKTGESRAASRDLALLAIEVVVQYAVTNLTDYRELAADNDEPGLPGRPADPDRHRTEMLRSVAQRELIEHAATLSVDEVLGAQRAKMSDTLRERIVARFAGLGRRDGATGKARGAGVEVLFVGVAGAHPPQLEEVASSFEGVVMAEQKSIVQIENGRADEIRTLARVAGDVAVARRIVAEIDRLEAVRSSGDERAITELEQKVEALLSEAGGEAASIIEVARAERWERHMTARAMAVRQEGRTALFKAAPALYRAKLYFDALLAGARDARVFITDFPSLRPRINFEEIESALGGGALEERLGN